MQTLSHSWYTFTSGWRCKMSSFAEFEEEVPVSDAELGSDLEVASEPAVDFAGARSCLQSCRGSGPGASTC